MDKTFGTAWADDFSVVRVIEPSRESSEKPASVDMSFSTSAIGNLFYPSDAVVVDLTVNSKQSLAEESQRVFYEVRDYWGARQCRPLEAEVEEVEKKGGLFQYHSRLDLGSAPLEVGVYYELHVRLPGGQDQWAHGQVSFAILPDAAANRYPPERVPFGAQGWTIEKATSQRIAQRLGCRWVRFHWSWPQLKHGEPILWDRLRPDKIESILNRPIQLRMRPYYTVAPGSQWERGKERYMLDDLRRGMRESVKRFGEKGMRTFKLGNEPPGWQAHMLERDVRAYQAMYEVIKQVEPNVLVISTSINNNHESFLKAGVGQYCDVIDCHIYRNLDGQRQLTQSMIRWAKQYGTPKPLWCTEMGTKGVGLSRRQYAIDCVSKQVVFFADGGTRVDWFALQTSKKNRGTYKDAFCLYNLDNTPRLDATAYYHLINQMTIKKFIGEADWHDGNEGFLFRDDEDNSLLVLWNRRRSMDVFVPLPDVGEVRLTYLDGRGSLLDAAGRGLTVRITEEPLLLTFKDARGKLTPSLNQPQITVETSEQQLVPGQASSIVVRVAKGAGDDDVSLRGPALWTIKKVQTTRGNDGSVTVVFQVPPPADTSVTSARFFATLQQTGKIPNAELGFALPMSREVSSTY